MGDRQYALSNVRQSLPRDDLQPEGCFKDVDEAKRLRSRAIVPCSFQEFSPGASASGSFCVSGLPLRKVFYGRSGNDALRAS